MNAPAFLGMIVILLAASPLIYLGGRLSGKDRATPVAQTLAVLALGLAWIPFVLAARGPLPTTWTFGAISLTLDGLGLLLAAVALGLGLLVAVFSGSYLKAEIGQEKFFAMLVAMVGVMIGLGVAADLFNLWIWFEAMAVCSYLLVAFHRDEPAALEAGVKYLVQSAAGSVMVLIGIALVFAETATLDLAEIQSVATASPALLAAGALFVIGFGVKTALVPLHTWLPDAHSMAPSGISAMLSGVVIEAGLVAMLRSIGALSGATPIWGGVLLALGAVNMLVGNLMALRQTQVKRLLAFSSLSHVGYMLLGIGVAALAGSALGAQGGLFHLVTHGMMKGLAFLAAGTLLFTLHLQRGSHAPLTVADLGGVAAARGVQPHQPRRGHLDLHVGQHVRNALVLDDRLAELHPLLRVLHGRFERGAGDARRLGRDRRAAGAQIAERDGKPLAALAQQVLGRDCALVEMDGTGVRSAHAELVLCRLLDETGRIRGHDERGNALLAEIRVGNREHHRGAGAPAVADEQLFAVQHPLAVLQHRSRAQVVRLRAGLRLGEAERADLATRGEVGEKRALLRLGAESGDRQAAHRVVHLDQHRRPPAAGGDLLHR